MAISGIHTLLYTSEPEALRTVRATSSDGTTSTPATAG